LADLDLCCPHGGNLNVVEDSATTDHIAQHPIQVVDGPDRRHQTPSTFESTAQRGKSLAQPQSSFDLSLSRRAEGLCPSLRKHMQERNTTPIASPCRVNKARRNKRFEGTPAPLPPRLQSVRAHCANDQRWSPRLRQLRIPTEPLLREFQDTASIHRSFEQRVLDDRRRLEKDNCPIFLRPFSHRHRRRRCSIKVKCLGHLTLHRLARVCEHDTSIPWQPRAALGTD
jgi:hypothetical protein